MEQIVNTSSALSIDTGGVLPMDTGATVNGTEGKNKRKRRQISIRAFLDHDKTSPVANVVVKKKGRGRPPKSPGSIKAKKTDGPKRSRGRPPKSSSVSKKVSKSSSPSRTNDGSKKKRGRPPSKNNSNKIQQVNR